MQSAALVEVSASKIRMGTFIDRIPFVSEKLSNSLSGRTILPVSLSQGRTFVFVSCMTLATLLAGGVACAKDITAALEGYRAQAASAALDNKCRILKPDERKLMDDYRSGLIAYVQMNDPNFISSKATIDANAERAARTVDCGAAAAAVRGSYEDAVVSKISVTPNLLRIAMSLGERCNAISKADDGTLMQAWVQTSNAVVKQYNASIRVKYVLRGQAAEELAKTLSCSDARQTVDQALKIARQSANR